ncbi:Kelch-like protein 40a [Orchesella cincta]|uniref:Kelch-like protein 40a n=1 Tax=Orchesella cincta TaxID=48709 RepID=A0A1D2MC27_ORCCI|nr:Kelch-like protein 40a [Orchesella cincta]
MYAKNGTSTSTIKLSIMMMLDDSFVKSLSNVLTEPTISIEGTFCNTSYPFKISGLKLKGANYVEDFEGAANIAHLLKQNTGYSNYGITFSIILEWKDVKITFKKERSPILEQLLSKKLLSDCCILAAEGKEVPCHRNILAVNSDVIHAMLTSGMEESRNNKIPMTDISEEVVNILLAYLYCCDINITEMKEDIAYDLLRTAHKYNIPSLQELMAVTLFKKPNNSFNMNTVLNVYYFTLNVEELNELCDKMLNILKGHPRKLLASTVYHNLLEKSPKEANKLALKLANREEIRAMLVNDMKGSKTNKIKMKDIGDEIVDLFLTYTNSGAINTKDMKDENAVKLLRVADKYNITPLKRVIATTLCDRPDDSFNTNVVLDLYLLTTNVCELNVFYKKMLNILKSNLKKLKTSSAYLDLLKNSPQEANKLLMALLELDVEETNIRALPST